MNLRELAQHLGLSKTTVSRALNGFSEVNEETRLRVLEAARRFNYTPNVSAKRLATGESGAFGVVLPGASAEMADPVFGEFLAGLADGAGRCGRDLYVNATFDGIRADALLFLLDQRGVHASVGSACRAGVHQPSEVLLAMGRTVDEAAQSLRFSLGRTTTDADIDRFVEVLPRAVEQARNV